MRRLCEQLFAFWCRLTAGGLILILGGLLLFLGWRGLKTLRLELFFGTTPVWEALTGRSPVWEGLWPACVGTLTLVLMAAIIAIPIGILSGIYLVVYATPRSRRVCGFLVDLLAGMPSVLLGLFGFALILWLRQTVLPAANTGLGLAAGCLALLVLPYLVVATRTALTSLPESLWLTGASLGLTLEQNLTRILLPAAAPGIMSGVILAVARIAEDTAVILLTGVVANAGLPRSWSDRFEALPFVIYYLAAEHRTAADLERAFAAALVLLLLDTGLLLWAKLLQRAFFKRWRP